MILFNNIRQKLFKIGIKEFGSSFERPKIIKSGPITKDLEYFNKILVTYYN